MTSPPSATFRSACCRERTIPVGRPHHPERYSGSFSTRHGSRSPGTLSRGPYRASSTAFMKRHRAWNGPCSIPARGMAVRHRDPPSPMPPARIEERVGGGFAESRQAAIAYWNIPPVARDADAGGRSGPSTGRQGGPGHRRQQGRREGNRTRARRRRRQRGHRGAKRRGPRRCGRRARGGVRSESSRRRFRASSSASPRSISPFRTRTAGARRAHGSGAVGPSRRNLTR